MTGLRRIYLIADDYGISPAVSAAIRDLIARGRLNATSVMVGAPSFDHSEAVSLSMLNSAGPRVAIGLHVTLTAPFRPISDDYRPLRDGAFMKLDDTLGSAMLRKLDPDSLAREISAQFAAFEKAFGHPPHYIDGHQHVHLFPQIRDAVLSAIKQHARDAWVRQCGRVTPLHKRMTDPKGMFLDWLSREFRRRAAGLGIKTNPAFAGTYDFSPRSDFTELFPRFLENMTEGGVVMCHPGRVDAELRSLDPVTTAREREYAYFAGELFLKHLQQHGLTLG